MADELERRVKTLEEELNGEKHLTRYAVEQTRRNSEVLIALRTEVRNDISAVRNDISALRSDVDAATLRLDHLTGDMAAVQAALAMHGRCLDVLMQDVRELRSEHLALQREVGELKQEVGALKQEIGELKQEMGVLKQEMGGLKQEMNVLKHEMGEINRKLDLLIAAVAPRDPA